MTEVKHRLRGALVLRRWRLESSERITQAEMGARIGVDLPRYNAYENGRARPGLDHAVAIKNITGVSVDLWTEEVSQREWERDSRQLDEMQGLAKAAS
jgi:transcriptional regulator with XRE-family HTH domain